MPPRIGEPKELTYSLLNSARRVDLFGVCIGPTTDDLIRIVRQKFAERPWCEILEIWDGPRLIYSERRTPADAG